MLISLAASLFLSLNTAAPSTESELDTPKLVAILPSSAPTPDGMCVDRNSGELIVTCPNYADQSQPACLLRVKKDGSVRKWVEVPVLASTGLACPMGIEQGPDGDFYICDNQGWKGSSAGKSQGRLLRLKIEGDRVVKTTVVASHLEHPNGVRIRDGKIYVTQSLLPDIKDPSGLLVSGVYRFDLDDHDIVVTNTRADAQLICTFVTQNRDCQYGADGLVFDKAGRLFVGNFGDGTLHRISFGKNAEVINNEIWAKNPGQLRTTDGICIDESDRIFVADFSENAVAMVLPDGSIRRLAKSLDGDGADGGLDQPGEPILWNGRLVLSCFDCVTGPDKVNTKHDLPSTLTSLRLPAGAAK